MKARIFFLSALLFAATSVSGAETTLFSTNFSDVAWSGITSVCSSANANDETYNGITFHSNNSTAKPFSIDQSAGTMTWCNNNMGDKFWIAIPVTGVNGSITITVANGSTTTNFKYTIKAETAISGSPGSGTNAQSSAGAPATVTKNSLTESSYVIYLGRQGSGMTTITSITITTPAPDCSATAPGDITKGTLVGTTITLTAAGSPAANNTWYWQAAADGTATAESGATKDVTAAGTYYIRSYYTTDDCWSDAKSITVIDEDFLTPSSAPVITTQPVGATYEAGEAAVPLSVEATGSGTLTYQWQRNGVDISGADESTYTPLSSGTYTCIIANTDIGSQPTTLTSDPAVITFKEGATFQYIIGYCKLDKGVWKQGQDGSFGIWKYIPNGDNSTIESSSDMSVSPESPSNASLFFTSKDLSHLKENDFAYWVTSSNSARCIKGLKLQNAALQLHLGLLQATKIELYGTHNSSNNGQIQLIAAGKETKTINTSSSDKQKVYFTELADGPYTGDEISISVGSVEQRFVVIVYTPAVEITYDANGGTGTMNTQLASPGETVQLRENEFTKTDYKFKGWTTDPAGTGEVIADAAMYIMGNSNTTLYAKWEEITYTTITLDATGAYNNYTHSVIATSDEPMPEIATLPARANYVFDGYYDQPNGAGTQYYTGLGAGVRNWDKTSPTATLYAKWLAPCDLVPTLTNVTPIISIWDQKKVDVGVVRLSCEFDTTGIEYLLQSVSPATPIDGCHFEYFDEQIHLMGTPNINNSSTQSVNVTFTMANNCSPASTYNITQTIRIYPQNQKAKVAFIITGTKGGGYDAYTASDASSCNTLVNYLGNYYDITFVNGYATKDADALATYYAQYDLLVVTDFLNTGEGYTNAIGTLIDKKPILSFEAYVASQSNWHIGSNPRDPKPKVQDMKVLCAGHAIFKNAKYNPGDASDTEVVRSDTTVHVLSSLSSDKEAKGLQGFVINEAPDFIFLATVRDADNNRDLIVCCERQMVFPARLLIYGINFHEMPNLSPSGKIIMRQMIDYLLMTDETKIADCSLIFDNKSGDHKWDNPANWAPGYNIIPTPYHPTRIIAECWVNVDNAHAGSVKVNKGRDEHNNPVDGKLIIKPYGGLTVAGVVTKVNDTRYASPLVIKAEDLLIEADDSNNGALVYGNKESDVRATIQYYSRGEGAGTANPVWQYIGIPFQAGKTAISMYREAWMCRWSSATTDGLGGLWQWVNNEDVLLPFEGYCITQADKKTYEFAGKLNAPVTKTISLDNRDADGFAFAANSWTAPIKIKEMQDADFTNVERSIYIYHTGTYASWDTNKDNIVNTQTNNSSVVPGQYTVVPIHSAPYIGVDSVIPAMQGFFVQTTSADAKLKLVYNRVVYDATYFKTSTQPMRAPKRAMVLDEPEVMQLTVSGESQGDRVHLLSQSAFSESFEDGWDGRKIEGDTAHAPTLAVVKEAGKMAVAAVSSFEERYLSFRAGEDTAYTFSFHYDGEPIYLYDQVTEQATQIKTGNTYSFSASNKTPAQRFLITKNPPLLPMDISLVETEGILHFENYSNELIEVRIVDMQGRVVWTAKSSDEIVDIVPSLPYGVYLAHVKMGNASKVIRVIGKEGAR